MLTTIPTWCNGEADEAGFISELICFWEREFALNAFIGRKQRFTRKYRCQLKTTALKLENVLILRHR